MKRLPSPTHAALDKGLMGDIMRSNQMAFKRAMGGGL
jgi:hypothetical protein